jgi:predicted Zn finger-like uncharacterized protein
MILTCPDCATSYFVDDSRVPPSGRTVKCSHCGAKWTATGEAAPEGATPAADPPQADPPTQSTLPVAEPPPDVEFSDEPAIVGSDFQMGAAARARARARLAPQRPSRQKGGPVIVWVAAAAVVVGLIASLLVFRSEVARIAPVTRGVYASVGLPANPLGLVIEQVRADPTFQGGRPALAVTGQIRNVRASAADSPSLRVSLLDRAGKPLAAKVAQPIDGRVPAGAVRHFAIAIVDPPASVHDLQVTFEADTARRPAAAALPRAAEAVLAGPQPVEARPLAPNSPDGAAPHD